jgi:hypothetical protein
VGAGGGRLAGVEQLDYGWVGEQTAALALGEVFEPKPPAFLGGFLGVVRCAKF